MGRRNTCKCPPRSAAWSSVAATCFAKIARSIGPARGSDNTIGDNNLLMVGTHIAHDCQVGNNVIFANNVLLAGHVAIEDRAFVSGAVGIHQFCRIGRLAMLGGHARVVQDVPPFVTVDGTTGCIVGLNLVGCAAMVRGGRHRRAKSRLSLDLSQRSEVQGHAAAVGSPLHQWTGRGLLSFLTQRDARLCARTPHAAGGHAQTPPPRRRRNAANRRRPQSRGLTRARVVAGAKPCRPRPLDELRSIGPGSDHPMAGRVSRRTATEQGTVLDGGRGLLADRGGGPLAGFGGAVQADRGQRLQLDHFGQAHRHQSGPADIAARC